MAADEMKADGLCGEMQAIPGQSDSVIRKDIEIGRDACL